MFGPHMRKWYADYVIGRRCSCSFTSYRHGTKGVASPPGLPRPKSQLWMLGRGRPGWFYSVIIMMQVDTIVTSWQPAPHCPRKWTWTLQQSAAVSTKTQRTVHVFSGTRYFGTTPTYIHHIPTLLPVSRTPTEDSCGPGNLDVLYQRPRRAR